MVRVSKCCCCIPIRTGAYIIGAFHVFGLILGVLNASLFLIALEVFCGCTFLYMLYRDAKQSRLFYFAAFCVYAAINALIHLVFVFWDHDEKRMVKANCKLIDEKVVHGEDSHRGWAELGFKDKDDCIEKSESILVTQEMIGMVIGLLIQGHYALVLYAHFKNADLVKSKGGCVDDPAESLQMSDVAPDTENSIS